MMVWNLNLSVFIQFFMLYFFVWYGFGLYFPERGIFLSWIIFFACPMKSARFTKLCPNPLLLMTISLIFYYLCWYLSYICPIFFFDFIFDSPWSFVRYVYCLAWENYIWSSGIEEAETGGSIVLFSRRYGYSDGYPIVFLSYRSLNTDSLLNLYGFLMTMSVDLSFLG